MLVEKIEKRGIKKASLQLSEQTGKSTLLAFTLAHTVLSNPKRIALYLESTSKAIAFDERIWLPIVESNEKLRDSLTFPQKRGETNMIYRFTGGMIMLTSIAARGASSSHTLEHILYDEIDEYPATKIIDLELNAEGRMSAFGGEGKVVFASTPNKYNKPSAIAMIRAKGTDRRYRNDCIHCGFRFDWSLKNIIISENVKEYVGCSECKEEFTDDERIKMLEDESSDWEATNDDAEDGHESFVAPRFISTLASNDGILYAYRTAVRNKTLPSFMAAVMGMSIEDAPEEQSKTSLEVSKQLFDNEKGFDDYDMIVAGVDVQGNRLEGVVAQWYFEDQRYHIIDRIVVMKQPGEDPINAYVQMADKIETYNPGGVFIDSAYEFGGEVNRGHAAINLGNWHMAYGNPKADSDLNPDELVYNKRNDKVKFESNALKSVIHRMLDQGSFHSR